MNFAATFGPLFRSHHHTRKPTPSETLCATLAALQDPPKRVLIVEDSLPLRAVIASKINADYEAEIMTASTYAEALPHLEQVDVAILDIKLPDGSGIELYKLLTEANPLSEVVFLTGYTNVEKYRRMIEAIGPARLVSKDALGHPNFFDRLMHFVGIGKRQE